MEQPREERRYTYADYCTWDDDFRCELIDGVIYVDGQPYDGDPQVATMMAPAPLWEHQEASVKLSWQLQSFLKNSSCKLFTAPFDVRMSAADKDDTVVQPDLVVICDRSKLKGTGCIGVPDMVIEISSPSTARRDRWIKYNLYQRAGVREYWIVDPGTRTVSVHVLLESGDYKTTAYGDTGAAPVSVLPGCEINLGEVFAE
ncbi:MAG: Uma2 family endonuclease [Oscillospiraceae bacterium]|nr:Uma2 family endonuclease [Oscillospiraceae bacterium]